MVRGGTLEGVCHGEGELPWHPNMCEMSTMKSHVKPYRCHRWKAAVVAPVSLTTET